MFRIAQTVGAHLIGLANKGNNKITELQVVLENIKVLNVKWQQTTDTKLSEKQTKKHLAPVS